MCINAISSIIYYVSRFHFHHIITPSRNQYQILYIFLSITIVSGYNSSPQFLQSNQVHNKLCNRYPIITITLCFFLFAFLYPCCSKEWYHPHSKEKNFIVYHGVWMYLCMYQSCTYHTNIPNWNLRSNQCFCHISLCVSYIYWVVFRYENTVVRKVYCLAKSILLEFLTVFRNLL